MEIMRERVGWAMRSASSPLVHALRLHPGDDLRRVLEARARTESILAAGVVAAVGSLTEARIRLAGAAEIRTLEGPLEIVALSGTVSANGAHLHMMVSDSQGRCVGGHVCEGCTIHTTAELMLLQAPGLVFRREHDERTGYPELRVDADGTQTPSGV